MAGPVSPDSTPNTAGDETAGLTLSDLLSTYGKVVLVTLAAALFLKMFVIEAYRIPSGSMENTLLVGDFLLVNKLAYGFRTPRYLPLTNVPMHSVTIPLFWNVERGDVVVFEYPGDRDEVQPSVPVNYVKRCIGLPGDTIVIRSGRVIVNGADAGFPARGRWPSTQRPSYWNSMLKFFPPGAAFTDVDYGPVVVPHEGMAIPLSSSNADRWKTFIEREGHTVEVDGEGRVRVDGSIAESYGAERDYFFVMGDNRDNSMDSRYWGFVPGDRVIGEALMVYWSWDPEISVGSPVDKARSIRWGRIGSLIR